MLFLIEELYGKLPIFVSVKVISILFVFIYSHSSKMHFSILAMMLKYTSVLQRYYIQYMSGFDNSLLKEILLQVRKYGIQSV